MRTPRRIALALAAVLAFAALTTSARLATAESATAIVASESIAFAPQEIVVSAGTTVVWTNQDFLAHTVTADDGSFDLGFYSPGETVSMTFDTPGTYYYYCIPHGTPGGFGMAGAVIVQ
jgi:plastocyanin